MSNEEVAINIIAYDNASKVMLMVAKSLNVVKEASLTINKAFDVTGSALASKLQGAGVYKGSFLDPKYADAFTDAVFNMQQKSNRYLNSVYDSVMKTGNVMSKQSKSGGGFKSIDSVLGDINSKIADKGRPFAGWAMSIMFAGMAVQKTFDSIWKSSTKTFQDISHSVEGTTTGFDIMEGSMKYLGFTIGSALEPVVMFLVPIIDKIADWVTENEKLTAAIVVGGLALGTLAMYIGMVKLAWDGLVVAGGKAGKALSWVSSPVGAGVLAALAALAVIGGLSWKAFSETPEAWKAVKDSLNKIDFSGITNSLKTMFEAIFGLEFNWENLAWTMAWAVNIGVSFLNILLGAVELLIDALVIVVDSFKVVGYAIRAAFKGDTASLDDLYEQADNLKEAFKEIGRDFVKQLDNAEAVWDAVSITPEGYKQQQLDKQKAEAAGEQIFVQLYSPNFYMQDGNLDALIEEIKQKSAVNVPQGSIFAGG